MIGTARTVSDEPVGQPGTEASGGSDRPVTVLTLLAWARGTHRGVT